MNLNPLRMARKAAGLTAFELAQAAGTREPRIYVFERDRHRPRKSEAEALSSVLGEPVSALFPEGVQDEY